MRTYQLYVKEEKAWVWVGTIDAPTHAEAFRLALLSLRPGDEDLAIRLEQDTSGDYRKPIEQRAQMRLEVPIGKVKRSAQPSKIRV